MRMSLIAGVLQQRLQGTQAEGLVEDLVDQPVPLVAVEQGAFGVAEVLDHQADLAAEHVAFQLAHLREVELVDQLAVDPLLRAPRSSIPSTCRHGAGAVIGFSGGKGFSSPTKGSHAPRISGRPPRPGRCWDGVPPRKT